MERRPRKILLVGGDREDIRLVSKACHSIGFTMLHAPNQEEALDSLRSSAGIPALIILDLDRPGIGEVGMLKKIRVRQPNLPVIVFSELESKQIESEYLGIDAFVKKPYAPESFVCRILFSLDCADSRKRWVGVSIEKHPAAKILIANERKEVCELLCVVLTEDVVGAHFDVAWGCSGKEVLELSREFKPDIGIVDIKMPDMWGHELIRHFKNGQGHVPKDFIIYSSCKDPEQIDYFKKSHYSVFLDLMQLEVLVEHLKNICSRHQLFSAA